MHVIAAKAVAFREALSDSFRSYQRETVTNAGVLADGLITAGINLVSGGTDNHMMLADLTSLDITGKDAEAVLGKAGLTVNKNSIPFETRSPFVTSGIRLGTPAITSRGMQAEQMRIISDLIAGVLKAPDDESQIKAARERVDALCKKFPLYGGGLD